MPPPGHFKLSVRAINFESFEQEVIATNLNGSMLFNFIMGIYTVVYWGTMYLYFKHRKPRRVTIVITAITVLYFLSLAILGVNWYSLSTAVVNNGSSRNSIFTELTKLPGRGSGWVNETKLFLGNIAFPVCDGLAIWRCFQLYNRSWRIGIALVVLLGIEIGLVLGLSILSVLFQVHTASDLRYLSKTNHDLQSSIYFTSACTTILASCFVARRVYKASMLTNTTIAKQISHVTEVVIESAALYSVVILVIAILNTISFYLPLKVSTEVESYIYTTIARVLGGIIQTSLVARIFWQSSGSNEQAAIGSTMEKISNIQFQSCSPTRSIESREQNVVSG